MSRQAPDQRRWIDSLGERRDGAEERKRKNDGSASLILTQSGLVLRGEKPGVDVGGELSITYRSHEERRERELTVRR